MSHSIYQCLDFQVTVFDNEEKIFKDTLISVKKKNKFSTYKLELLLKEAWVIKVLFVETRKGTIGKTGIKEENIPEGLEPKYRTVLFDYADDYMPNGYCTCDSFRFGNTGKEMRETCKHMEIVNLLVKEKIL